MALLLKVAHPSGAVFEYGPERLERGGEVALSVRATETAVETGDVELLVDGDFLGASALAQLPLGTNGERDVRYRAAVEVAGVPLVNGVIRRRGGLAHEPEAERWVVVVEADAASRLLEDLEALDLSGWLGVLEATARNLGLPPTHYLVRRQEYALEPYVPPRPRPSLRYWRVVDRTIDELWLGPSGIILAAFALLGSWHGHVWEGPGSAPGELLIQQRIERASGVHLHHAHVGVSVVRAWGAAPGLPPWETSAGPEGMTVRALFEEVQAMMGWRLKARYAEFPSPGIVAAVARPYEDEVTPAVVLDHIRAGAPTDDESLTPRSIEPPPLEDVALAYAGRVADAERPYPQLDVEEGVLLYNEADRGVHGLLAPPPRHELVDAAEPLRLDKDGRPDHETVIELPHRRPFMQLNPWDFLHPEEHAPGLTRRVMRSPRVGYWNEEGKAEAGTYLGELVPDRSEAGVWRLLGTSFWYEGASALPASGTTAVSPRALLANLGSARAERLRLEVSVDLEGVPEGAFAVGDPARGVELEGQRYVVMEMERSLDTHVARLVLERPIEQAPPVGGGAPGALPGPAVTASFSCAGYDREADDGVAVTFAFEAAPDPTGEAGPVHSWEYSVRPPGRSSPWTAPAQTASETVTVTGQSGIWNARVRAVYGDGGPAAPRSAWTAKGANAQCGPEIEEV